MKNKVKILDEYVLKEPTNQNILDISKDEWSSKLPSNNNLITNPGISPLFEDSRVTWAEEVLGSFCNLHILELGPLEGGHSYMLEKSGAKKVISIEANTHAFLKCLCIKEIMDLHNVEFKLGDFISYLKNTNKLFDVVFASGVLYHMMEPLQLLKLISVVTNRVFIWTHYYDKEIIASNKELTHKFSDLSSLCYEGNTYFYSTQSYKKALNWAGFCGGPEKESTWLTKESLLDALHQFGFNEITINFEDPNHPNGPALALCAKK
jgi:hypothetical protein